MTRSTMPINLDLYLVTDRDLSKGRSLDWIVEKAVKGGVTIIQMREKDMETKKFIEEAKRIKKILEPYNIPLIINDRVDVALAIGADGVHLGQTDMPYPMARKILGNEAIIGLSVESIEQAEEANQFDVDYIAISPVFTTPTKEELTQELGISGVQKITGLSKHPSVGIGSIKPHNAESIIKAGADGIAVVSAICSAENPEEAAVGLIAKVQKAKSLME